MKKFLLSLLLIFTGFVLPGSVSAQTKMAEFGFETGPHFRAGDTVTVNESLQGDVYVAGGNVRITGTVAGDLIVAGGNVELAGEVTDDLRIAGGTVLVNGTVGKNVTAAGGNVVFGAESLIGGSVIAGGGTVSYDGQVAGNVLTGGGVVDLSGEFGSNVQAEAETLVLSADSEISGDLKASYVEDAQIDEAAVVRGARDITQNVEAKKSMEKVDKNALAKVAGKVAVAGMVIGFLMSLITGLVLLYLFPKVSTNLQSSILERPMATLGWGFVQLIMLPILSIILMVTVLGLPIGVLMLMFFIISLILAGLVGSYALGQKIFDWTKIKALKNPYLQLTVGLLIFKLLDLIPILGWLIKLALVVMGLGAILVFLSANLRKEGKKKIK